MLETNETALEVRELKKYFRTAGGLLKAVDGVSFTIRRGETLGLVGESGCGKTTCGRTCVGLYRKTGGQVLYRGKDVHSLRGKDRKAFTKQVQTIFQDPYASLDPRLRVEEIVAEGMRSHGICPSPKERRERVYQLLEQVGLNREHAGRYIHEFSGGQRQRIGIARALAVDPEFVFCDEPISALDVSIQAQIVNLLVRLQEERGLTYLFIAHDLSMVKHISDRVAVMYLGTIVEITTSAELYSHPAHPYTKALLSAIPIPNPRVEEQRVRTVLEGEVPSPINLPPGCRFHSRCPCATDRCAQEAPVLREIAPGHSVACHIV